MRIFEKNYSHQKMRNKISHKAVHVKNEARLVDFGRKSIGGHATYKYILRVIFGPNHEIKNIFFHHQVLPCKKLFRQIRGTLGSLFGYSTGQNYTSQYIFGLCDLKHARAG